MRPPHVISTLVGLLLAAGVAFGQSEAGPATRPVKTQGHEPEAIVARLTEQLERAAASGDVRAVSALLIPATPGDAEMIEPVARSFVAVTAARAAIVEAHGKDWQLAVPSIGFSEADLRSLRLEQPEPDVIIVQPAGDVPAVGELPGRFIRSDGRWHLAVSRGFGDVIGPEHARLFMIYFALGLEESLEELRAGRMGEAADPWTFASRKGLEMLLLGEDGAGDAVEDLPEERPALERLRRLQDDRAAERRRRAAGGRPPDDAPAELLPEEPEAMQTPIGAARALAAAVERGDVELAAAMIHGEGRIARGAARGIARELIAYARIRKAAAQHIGQAEALRLPFNDAGQAFTDRFEAEIDGKTATIRWLDDFPAPGNGSENLLIFRRDGEVWKLDPRSWVDVDEAPEMAAEDLRELLAWVAQLERGVARVEAGELKTFDAIRNAYDRPEE